MLTLDISWIFFAISMFVYIIVDGYFVGKFGPADYRSMIASILISILLLIMIAFSKRLPYYGLKRVKNVKKYLYFSPLIFLSSVNLWNGINVDCSVAELIFFVLRMINIGFIEEMICRGFLFRALERYGKEKAMCLSSVFFGIVHILNLFFGVPLITVILKIIYSTAIGYLYVVIFSKSGSLFPCIIAHQIFNSLCIFDNHISIYVLSIVIVAISICYSAYIKKLPEESSNTNIKQLVN